MVRELKNLNLSEILEENTVLGIKPYLGCLSAKKNFFGNFVTLFSMFLASFIELRAVEAVNLQKTYFSPLETYKFRMFTSCTAASLKQNGTHARLFLLTIGVSTK